jgi:hypothetical protein
MAAFTAQSIITERPRLRARQRFAEKTKRRGSSVVERVIGNDEVGGSVPPRGTISPPLRSEGLEIIDLKKLSQSLKTEPLPCCVLSIENICRQKCEEKPYGVDQDGKPQNKTAYTP